ncbi:hypothetical protein [Yersinia phage vB_YenM_P744]
MWVTAAACRAPNGWKNTGIEYRIMREAGLTIEPRTRDPDGVGATMVKCAEILTQDYADEIRAVYVWAQSGFNVAAVRRDIKCTVNTAHTLILRGEMLMHSSFLTMKSISYVADSI